MNDAIVSGLCDAADAMVEQSREDAWEELERQNSLREAAHVVTMRVARGLRMRYYPGPGFRCPWCAQWWTAKHEDERLDPQNHPATCIWRIASAYAADVTASTAKG